MMHLSISDMAEGVGAHRVLDHSNFGTEDVVSPANIIECGRGGDEGGDGAVFQLKTGFSRPTRRSSESRPDCDDGLVRRCLETLAWWTLD